jgi:enoyl-CoA hydratase
VDKTDSAQEVLVARDGPILTLTFNRPEARNAMTWNMYQRLYETCEEVDADDSIRVLVLKGAGGKAFVAGTDISQFTKFKGAEDGIAYERDGDKRAGRVSRVKKPVIVQIEGPAVGGGFGIAAGADIRIATPEARFGVPIARTLGNCLSMSNVSRITAVVGPARVKDLIFTARLIDAAEAASLGLLNEVVDDLAALEKRADQIARLVAGNAPLTLSATKQAVARLQKRLTREEGEDLILMCYTSQDFREGLDAFLTKRAPQWRGQ